MTRVFTRRLGRSNIEISALGMGKVLVLLKLNLGMYLLRHLKNVAILVTL